MRYIGEELFFDLTHALYNIGWHSLYTYKLLHVGGIVLNGPYHRFIVEVGDDIFMLPCAYAEVIGAADDMSYSPVLFEVEGSGVAYGIHAAQVVVDAECAFAVEYNV